MPVKDFDVGRRERLARRDPITFVLGGETFTLVPAIPIGVTLDLADAPEPAPETLDESVAAIVRFLKRAMRVEDVERFQALLDRREDPIDALTLIDLAAWVAFTYAAGSTPPDEAEPG